MVRKLAAEGREIYAADDHWRVAGEPLEVSGLALSIPRRAATPRALWPSWTGSPASMRST
jgi:hypothetical protein